MHSSQNQISKRLHSIAVFCGSKQGNDPAFIRDAEILGQLMAQLHVKLIYGGGSKGLMGAVADAVLENGGSVTGIIPELLVTWEQQHPNLTELIVVPDMHTRKKLLYEKADAAIILPGGFGTLDEFFEMLTWNNLNIHNKPIFLLNTNQFYVHLMAHIKQMYKEGFLYAPPEERLIVLNTPADLLNSGFVSPSNKK